MNISIEEFYKLTSSLKGMAVSHPWKGFGSALFLELGELRPLDSPADRNQKGEATIYLAFEWRLEKDKKIICGSSNTLPLIARHLKILKQLVIISAAIEGQIPELIIQLSDGYLLRTMSLMAEESEWNIESPDGSYIYFKRGELFHDTEGNNSYVPSPEEDFSRLFAEITASRWGTPIKEPIKGNCIDCKYFLKLDADFLLLDYGACGSSKSVFDASVVSSTSGCPEFEIKVS